MGFYQEQGWNLWKNQIPSGGALGRQKVGAGVKVVKDSQCQPGPDCREYDAVLITRGDPKGKQMGRNLDTNCTIERNKETEHKAG